MENLTQAEIDFYFYKKGATGSFTTSLIETFFKADDFNFEKLRLGFPEMGDVVFRFMAEPGYWETLKKEIEKKK